MKTIKLTVLLLLFPLVFFAQTLTGLWTGTLTNDSSTIRRDQSFEIVLTQYKNKVYGYSRMTFFVHDTLYYIVKRVKGTIEGEVCEVRDDDIITHNFPRKPEKGVKLVSIFRRNKQDSLWYLDGDWKTTESKKYYAISGKISLKPETDPEKSKLMPHLEELKLADDVAFYKASKKVSEPVATISQPVKDKPRETVVKEEKNTVIPIKETKTEVAAQTKRPEIKEKPIVAETKDIKKDNVAVVPIKSEPVVTINQPVKDRPKETVVKEEKITAIPGKETRIEPVATINQPVKDKPKETVVKEEKITAIPGKETRTEPVATINQPVKDKPKETVVKEEKITAVPGKETETTAQTKQPISDLKKEQPVIAEKKIAAPVKNNKKDSLVFVQAKSNPVIQTNQPVTDPKKPAVVKEEPKKSEPVVTTKPVEQKKEPVIETIKPEIKNKEVASIATANDKQQPVSLFSENKPVVAPTAAVFVGARKTTAPQVVNFKSDSLELALYDNGEIDGDTVSILLNGEIILAKQGLKVSAIKKTIYVPAGKDDSLTLVLYAENLGKYPPNTGLLVVHDGEDTYQIRFSADLQQNATVIFKRRKN